MSAISRVVARVVKAGRVKHSFAVAVVLALVALPLTEALAYFGATGSGTISNVSAGTANATVSFATQGVSTYVYGGGSSTNLVPGGTVQVPLTITCTANPPCVVSSLSLATWSSNKTGCDPASLPNSFSITANTATFPISIAALNGTGADSPTITWANLPTTNQGACAGATFTFNIATP